MKTCLPAGQKRRQETCLKDILQCLQEISSNWRKTSMIWAAYMSSSKVFEDMSLPCLLTIEHYHLFLDAQLKLQPIQPGEHAVCELWIACVCHHIKNGWRQEMAGLLWFVRSIIQLCHNLYICELSSDVNNTPKINAQSGNQSWMWDRKSVV